jgi:hypothetical protein
MKRQWRVDRTTTVALEVGSLGAQKVTVNGEEFFRRRSFRGKNTYDFVIPSSGTKAALDVRPQFVGGLVSELRVGGKLVAEGSDAIQCRTCGSPANSYDSFCASCGRALPPPESYAQVRELKSANNTIKYLAILYLIVGVIYFFVTKSKDDAALSRIADMSPEAIYPQLVLGKQYTVAALRNTLAWEPWSVLLVNAILAGVMTALFFWGKRAPLAAILVAGATYAVVNVTNAIIDPRTIAQGLIVKIIIIGVLIKGIKAALALRTRDG